jgi:glycosyltransferase involved in cell wall biosynthesis
MNDTNSTALVGVAIPTLNRQGYLAELLKSIPITIPVVVSDNGNYLDPTFKTKYSRVNYYSSTDILPLYENWNRAVSKLDTEWVCLASDDDIFCQDAFANFHETLKLYPNAELIIFGHKTIDEDGTITGEWTPKQLQMFLPPFGFDKFKYGVDARCISVFFKKDLYYKIGCFNETYKVTASDSDFIQTALIFGKSVFNPTITGQYRVWKNNLTAETCKSTLWIEEIYYWQNRIAGQLKQFDFSSRYVSSLKDEVVARNIIQALTSYNSSKEPITVKIKFLLNFSLPLRASLKTKLILIKCLLKPSYL